MGNAFSVDSKFMQFLDRFSDLLILSVLTIICSVPIVTIGASVTAMYHVTFKMANDEDGKVFKPFFKAFKENFKKSTILWLIALAVMAVAYGDYYIVYQMNLDFGTTPKQIITLASGAFVLVALFIGTYIFPLTARFENTLKNTVKNALILSVMNIPKTILLIVINLAPIAIGFISPLLWPPMLLLAFGGSSFVASKIYIKIFKKVTHEDDEDAEDTVLPTETDDSAAENRQAVQK